jgi:uncharacterized protein
MTADSGITGAGQLPDALIRDPRPDAAWPAQTLAQAIPSHGVNLNAVLYTAAGAGPHPTILLLHGLPGNEQNLDLAQSIRRAGWNVLTLHYRGSWGTPGTFSFAHCLEDAAATIDWLRSAEAAPRIDSRKLVVIGTAERLGGRCWQGMTGRVFDRLGIKDGMGLVETGVEGSSRSVDVLVIR